jgi:hypothetical protein
MAVLHLNFCAADSVVLGKVREIEIRSYRYVLYIRAIHSRCVHKQSSLNVCVSIQSNTTCYSFSNGVYYISSDMFRPYHNGHLQASMLGGVVNTIVIRNILGLVSCAQLAVYYHILVGGVVVK